MDHVLNVLTQPRHLDSISRRVKLLVVELERASSTSRRAGSAPTSAGSTTGGSGISAAEQEALQALFGLLPRLDPLIPIIPPLLARLRSLSTLHAEALGIAADLRELQSADRSVSEEERELSSIVKGVQHGVTEALASIQNNWEATQGRIQALDKRVAALGK
jgi:nuclear migration protein JNM1